MDIIRNCKTCGREFHSYGSDHKVCGECKLEKQALALAADYAQLRKRLNSARSCLKREYKLVMKNALYRFREKRLVSRCGGYELKWQTRSEPNLPVSYDNQQTTVGCVVFNRIARVHFHPELN